MFRSLRTARTSTDTTKKDQESGQSGLRKVEHKTTGTNILLEAHFDADKTGTAGYDSNCVTINVVHHDNGTATITINGKEFGPVDIGYYEYTDPEEPDMTYWVKVWNHG